MSFVNFGENKAWYYISLGCQEYFENAVKKVVGVVISKSPNPLNITVLHEIKADLTYICYLL